MSEIFTSIIIPCLNEIENIEKCINALKGQSYNGAFEIIAVDNGSTDNTIRIIKGKGVILEHAKKRGPAAAKNKGIEKAKGNIIVFIDADCVAHPAWLDNIMKPFKDMSIGCVAGEIIPYKPRTRIEQFLCEKKHLSQSINVNHNFLPYAATANAAYRKEVFDKVGFFDESLFTGEDADMSWRMRLQTNYKLSYSPEAIVYHPHETGLKALFKQKQRHAYGAVALYKKYRRFWPEQSSSLKKTYWEYRSITMRALLFVKDYFLKGTKNLNESHFQTILEAGLKLGLIRGSLRHRVWYI